MNSYKMKLNPDKEHVKTIREGLKANNGYCPCTVKSEDSKCPCKDFRENKNCHCNLYIQEAASTLNDE